MSIFGEQERDDMQSKEKQEKNHFSEIYTMYFPKMLRFAKEYLVSEEDAKNVIQDLFLYLWEHRGTLDAVSNMNAFLFTLTKNRCIDFYRIHSKKAMANEPLESLHERELSLKMEALRQFDENMFTTQEIEVILDNAINNLPEKCRQVFILSRMEGLKQEEIARQLNISVNTVQNHMSAALRKLKVELKDYLPLFFFFI